MEKFLIVDADKCMACGICELVCSFIRDGEYNPRRSFIKVLRNEEMNVHIPVLQINAPCDKCGKCVESCPTEALQFVKLEDAALIRKTHAIGRFPAPLIKGE